MTPRRFPLFVVAALLVFGGCTAPTVGGETNAPGMVLGERVNGAPVTLAQQRGKVVIVSYWASWCPPCWVEMPQLQSIYTDYRRRGLVVFAVNQGETTESIDKFIERQPKPFNLTILRDPKMAHAGKADVRGVPTTIVFDRSGREVKRYTGMFGFDSEAVRELLDRLLAGA